MKRKVKRYTDEFKLKVVTEYLETQLFGRSAEFPPCRPLRPFAKARQARLAAFKGLCVGKAGLFR